MTLEDMIVYQPFARDVFVASTLILAVGLITKAGIALGSMVDEGFMTVHLRNQITRANRFAWGCIIVSVLLMIPSSLVSSSWDAFKIKTMVAVIKADKTEKAIDNINLLIENLAKRLDDGGLK